MQPIAESGAPSPGTGAHIAAAPRLSQSKRGRTAKGTGKGGSKGAVLAAALPLETAAWAAQTAHFMSSGAGRSFQEQRQWDTRAVQILEQNLLKRVQVAVPLRSWPVNLFILPVVPKI